MHLGFFYYLSSTLNPLLYTILSVKYRESFKKVILRSDILLVTGDFNARFRILGLSEP